MIRTIKQRIYIVGLIPLAALAVALVLFNGLYRIEEANRELHNAQEVTANLLNSAAGEALVLGNTLTFEQLVTAAIRNSPTLICVRLSDSRQRIVAQVGDCVRPASRMAYFQVEAQPDGLSDFNDPTTAAAAIGELGIFVSERSVIEKRRQIVVQLVLSLALIGGVLWFVGRLLRARLIEPIQRIDSAMHGLSERNYDAIVRLEGDDELARLAREVNSTIRTVETYTRELERHRRDADRALQDADEANLSRESLVRTLTEEFEEPLNRLHSQLTAIAMANQDPSLKEQIKHVLALLQEAQGNFVDLIELASSAPATRRAPMRPLSDLLEDIRQEIELLSQSEVVPINFILTEARLVDTEGHSPTGIYVDLDGARLRKALAYLIRAMARRCKLPGLYVNTEVIRKSPVQLHVSVHLRGFYDLLSKHTETRLIDGLNHYASSPPTVFGWTERETRIVAYLFRAVGIAPVFATLPDGTVSVLLEATCAYTVDQTAASISTAPMLAANPVSAVIVSDDPSLSRLTARADLSDFDVKLLSFSRAVSDVSSLRGQDALLIDVTDIAAALRLLDRLKGGETVARLIAICPPGHVSDSLSNRLFELGFAAIAQKPLQYSRVVQILRAAMADPLGTVHRNSRPSID